MSVGLFEIIIIAVVIVLVVIAIGCCDFLFGSYPSPFK